MQIFSYFRERTKINSNLIGNYVIMFVNIILPIIILPIIAKRIGVINFGYYIFLQSVAVYIVAVTDFGMSSFGVSYIAKNMSMISEIYSSSLFLRTLTSLASIPILIYVIVNYLGDQYNLMILAVSLVMSYISGIIMPVWVANGAEISGKFSRMFAISRIFSSVLVLISCYFTSQFEKIFFVFSFTNLLSNLTSTVFICRILGIRILFNYSEIVSLFKLGLENAIAAIASTIFSGSLVIVAKIYGTPAELAYIGAADRISRGVLSLFSPLTISIQPIISKMFSKSYLEGRQFLLRTATLTLLVYIIFTCTLYFLSEHILSFFGKSFLDGKFALPYLFIWGFFGVANNFLGIQYIMGRGFYKLYAQIFNINVIFLLVLFYFLPRFFGITGVLLSIVIAEFILTLCFFCFVTLDFYRESRKK